MAKLSAPLLSFGASGQIGKALVFFPWKGLNVARKHVVPANPKSAAQVVQRGHVTSVVALVHTAMADTTHPLNAADKAAYSLLASVMGIIMTWFNAAVKVAVEQLIGAKKPAVYNGGVMTPGAGQVAFSLYFTKSGANSITAGDVWYGATKSALLSSVSATVAAAHITATATGLAAGTKYYFQFRPTAHADYVGNNSGVYFGTPT